MRSTVSPVFSNRSYARRTRSAHNHCSGVVPVVSRNAVPRRRQHLGPRHIRVRPGPLLPAGGGRQELRLTGDRGCRARRPSRAGTACTLTDHLLKLAKGQQAKDLIADEPGYGKALPDASAYHGHVALGELSQREILQAVAEFDRLGQDRFLEKYGFGAARSYRLVVDGKTYDSKAIVGAAHGFFPGQEPLTAHDFSSRAATVGHLLSRLGFEVTQAYLA